MDFGQYDHAIADVEQFANLEILPRVPLDSFAGGNNESD